MAAKPRVPTEALASSSAARPALSTSSDCVAARAFSDEMGSSGAAAAPGGAPNVEALHSKTDASGLQNLMRGTEWDADLLTTPQNIKPVSSSAEQLPCHTHVRFGECEADCNAEANPSAPPALSTFSDYPAEDTLASKAIPSLGGYGVAEPQPLESQTRGFKHDHWSDFDADSNVDAAPSLILPTPLESQERDANSSAAPPALSTSSDYPAENTLASTAIPSLRGHGVAEPKPLWQVDTAPSLILPTPETPLYNALLEKLSTTGDEGMMESLAECCVFDKLKFKQPYNSPEQPADKSDDPYLLGLRIEHLLAVANTQRSNQLARLASRHDPRATLSHELVFNTDDMIETMNAWRKQPETWMDVRSLKTVNALETQQAYHQAVKKRFTTMLFQLFGSKCLVELFIRFPICSVEQPASLLKSFAKAWQSFRNTPEADGAREISQRNETGEVRLSKQIYALQQSRKRAQWIAEWVDKDWNNWDKLSHDDQRLWSDHKKGTILRQITELRKQQQKRFPGAAEILATREHFSRHL